MKLDNLKTNYNENWYIFIKATDFEIPKDKNINSRSQLKSYCFSRSSEHSAISNKCLNGNTEYMF